MPFKIYFIGKYWFDGIDWWVPDGSGTDNYKANSEVTEVLNECMKVMNKSAEEFAVWVKNATKEGKYSLLGEQVELLVNIYKREKTNA